MERERKGSGYGVVRLHELPECCLAYILSLTSPKEVCMFSLISHSFHDAAESDSVWQRFLPPDYPTLLTQSVRSPSSLNFASKKDMYFYLCDFPILIDNGDKSFWLDRSTGKKCLMLAAFDLSIAWADTPVYWMWVSQPGSRFPEVAMLNQVCWLEIRGKVNTRMLSPATNYGAYLVYKLTSDAYGFESYPAEVSVVAVGGETTTQTVCLEPRIEQMLRSPDSYFQELHVAGFNRWDMLALPRPSRRRDGWIEILIGEFFSGGGGENEEVEMSVKEVKGGVMKTGIIIEGIEIRPKAR